MGVYCWYGSWICPNSTSTRTYWNLSFAIAFWWGVNLRSVAATCLPSKPSSSESRSCFVFLACWRLSIIALSTGSSDLLPVLDSRTSLAVVVFVVVDTAAPTVGVDNTDDDEDDVGIVNDGEGGERADNWCSLSWSSTSVDSDIKSIKDGLSAAISTWSASLKDNT